MIVGIFILVFLALVYISYRYSAESFQDGSGNLVEDSMKTLMNTILPKIKFQSDEETEILLSTNELSESELIAQELQNQVRKSLKDDILSMRTVPLLPNSNNVTSDSLQQGIQSQSNLPTIGR